MTTRDPFCAECNGNSPFCGWCQGTWSTGLETSDAQPKPPDFADTIAGIASLSDRDRRNRDGWLAVLQAAWEGGFKVGRGARKPPHTCAEVLGYDSCLDCRGCVAEYESKSDERELLELASHTLEWHEAHPDAHLDGDRLRMAQIVARRAAPRSGEDPSYVDGLQAAAVIVDNFMSELKGAMDRGIAYAIGVEIRKAAYDVEQRRESPRRTEPVDPLRDDVHGVGVSPNAGLTRNDRTCGRCRQLFPCECPSADSSSLAGPEIVAWLEGLEQMRENVVSVSSDAREVAVMIARRGVYEGVADDIKRKWPALFTSPAQEKK